MADETIETRAVKLLQRWSGWFEAGDFYDADDLCVRDQEEAAELIARTNTLLAEAEAARQVFELDQAVIVRSPYGERREIAGRIARVYAESGKYFVRMADDRGWVFKTSELREAPKDAENTAI